MRTFRLATVVAVAILAAAPAVGAQATGTLKIGFVRSQALLQGAPGRAEAEAQFEKEMGSYRTQVQRMGDSLNALVADLRKNEASLSSTAKETRQRAIVQREEEYQNRTRQLEQQAQQRQLELIRPITELVQRAISEVRAEEGYAMLFDADAQGSPLVAADTTLDATPKVLAKLQVLGRQAATPAKPAAKPAGPAVGQPAGVSRPRPPQR